MNVMRTSSRECHKNFVLWHEIVRTMSQNWMKFNIRTSSHECYQTYVSKLNERLWELCLITRLERSWDKISPFWKFLKHKWDLQDWGEIKEISLLKIHEARMGSSRINFWSTNGIFKNMIILKHEWDLQDKMIDMRWKSHDWKFMKHKWDLHE